MTSPRLGRPSCEGRGLKPTTAHMRPARPMSPLMRGAWIETSCAAKAFFLRTSPLMRGAWIETLCNTSVATVSKVSPLMRGAWIETMCPIKDNGSYVASPLMRGAWIETSSTTHTVSTRFSRPSCEGRGLKLRQLADAVGEVVSPLMRGAWIETRSTRAWRGTCRVAPHARGVD